MVKFENIEIKYGDFVAIENLNLDIKEGEFFTFLGPSGCGKTTSLRALVGFLSPSKGKVYVGDKDVTNLPVEKRNIGMVFQSYALFPTMSVYDNIAFGMKVKKASKTEIDQKVHEVAAKIKITESQLKKNVSDLSGGQQQRVALARAIVLEPKILCLDEPLSNLDAKLRVYMRKEIRKIQQRIGITSVYVTHDQAEAMSLSDKIIIMNKGHIEQVGTPHEVYQHPASRFVADFIGSANFVEAKVGEGDSEGEMIPVRMLNEDFNVHYAGLPVKAGDTVQIVLRPEAIRLADSGDVEAEVVSSTYMGAVQEYVVRAGDKELETEEYNPEGKRIYRPGDKVWLRIQRDALHAVEN